MEEPNLSYIQNMSGGDTEFEQQLIQIIKKEFPVERALYSQNMANKAYDLAAENVHKIKHKISILGLEESYVLANKFEQQLGRKESKLHLEFEKILDKMEAFINHL